MSSSQFYLNSVPEQVPVTINTNVVQLDANVVLPRQERFSINFDTPFNIYTNDTGLYKYMHLLYIPIRSDSVQLFKNSGLQRKGPDFTVYGQEITLSTPATTEDEYVASYLTIGAVEAFNESLGATGTITGFDYILPTDAPSGWLAMDGVTPHLIADFSALHDWLIADPARSTYFTATPTTFTLALLQGTIYNGIGLVVLKQIIKT